MRILIVTNTYPPADITGVGALVFDLARRLDGDGHAVRVLTRTAAADDALASATGGRKLFFPWHVARLYWRCCREQDFDLVHVHESDGVLVCSALRLARWLGRPAGRARLVATLQVSYRRERWAVRKLRATGSAGKMLSRPTFSERIFAFTRAPILSFLGRLTARLSDAVVAPSAVTAEELRQDYGAKVDGVIANGIATSQQHVSAQHVSTQHVSARPEDTDAVAAEDGFLHVLYAGRLRTRKAVAVLVEAFASVRREHPQARLVLAGEGEQRPALERQVKALGLGDGTVRFLGAIPRHAMVDWYRRADIFCLPSIYEGFPLAILEAMDAGLPVVTTTASGMPEAIVDGESGLLVPPEDVDALGRALGRLLEDHQLRRSMGEAARRRVQEHFTIERIGAEYLALWQRLLPSSSAPSGAPSRETRQ